MIVELIITAFESINSNKARTVLTCLGIIIGISSVITLIAAGNGTQASVAQSLSSLGTNTITISSGRQRTGLVFSQAGGTASLTVADVTMLKDKTRFPHISGVSPEVSRNFQLVSGDNNSNTSVTGVYPDYANVRNYTIADGEFISDEHIIDNAKVAVIGSDTATNLFPGESAIGKSFKIDTQQFRVIGVFASKGTTGPVSNDDIVVIPLTTAQNLLLGSKSIRSITVKVDDVSNITTVQSDISDSLLAKHKIDDPTKADFTISNSQDTLNTLSTITGTLTTLLAAIGAISLVVGGIGIMNIMIITVTERTREIGLRKAVGAEPRIILLQFLIESIVITLLGGVTGILLGIALSFILNATGILATSVSAWSIALAFGVSAAIGIVFGIYPAQKAARMSPIDALKYE